MSKYDDLVKKLKEIFQIDRPELDFGVYRILNSRVGEINEYLEKRLKAKVQDSLSKQAEGDSSSKIKELTAKIRDEYGKRVFDEQGRLADEKVQASDLGQQLIQMQSAAPTAAEHENAVFTHLLTFFSRYYDKGDFVSQRRYKGDTYAIPYAGEEVLLHWANKDQYYIKSGENFANYAFKLDNGRIVRFRLVTADTAKDNRKDNDKERRFALIEPHTRVLTDEEGEEYEEKLLPVSEVNGELVLRFEYKSMPKGSKQEVLVSNAVKIILADPTVKTRWLDLSNREPTEKNPQRTLLEKCLTSYTMKNTTDYFIHKDLGGFLRRELDFYIKNEVMHLDDVQNAIKFSDIEKNLRLIQTLRAIALDLITFLAQLEDFQKKLWLKKKFVVATHYCITLDRIIKDVPELLDIIAANERQWELWYNMGLLDGNKADLFAKALSESVEYLKAHSYLMADTSLFDITFKHTLLAAMDNLDESLDGLLIQGDNFQALNLLQERYRGLVKCIYIDPPFNLGQNADFHYKTDYKDSSWSTLLMNRIELSTSLLSDAGMIYVRCDLNGNYLVRSIMDSLMGSENFQSELLVQRIRKNVTSQGRISLPLANDSLFFYTKQPDTEFCNPYTKLAQTRESYWRRIDDSAGFRNPPERKIFGKVFFPYKHDAHFKYSQGSIDTMIGEGRIRLRCKSCSSEHSSGPWLSCDKCGSEEAVPQYLVMATDKKILDTNWLDIAGYSHTTGFSTENSEALLIRSLDVGSEKNDLVLDFFAGSGTTQAAAMKSGRKWLGVEQGEQLDVYIIPRMMKIAFENKISHAFKVLKIESYEDTLNNLQLRRTPQQQSLLDSLPQSAQEDYLLRYLLNIESRGSLLSVEQFNQPFDCKLKVAVDSAGAYEERTIDLVETFNYLLGLRVKHIDMQCDKGFVSVTGWLPTGEKTLVLWRDAEQVDYENLNRLCDKLAINPADSEFEVVYVNGDHNIPAVFTSTEAEGGITKTLKIRQIEPEFLSRMFAVEGV